MNQNFDELISQILNIQSKCDNELEKLARTNATIEQVKLDIDQIRFASNDIQKQNFKLTEKLNDLEVELLLNTNSVNSLKENLNLDMKEYYVLLEDLKQSDEYNIGLSNEFEKIYNDFISKFDIGFDYNQNIEREKQFLISNELNLISQIENEIKWLNDKKLKNNLEFWKEEVEKLSKIESELTNELQQVHKKIKQIKTEDINKLIESNEQILEMKQKFNELKNKTNEAYISELTNAFNHLNELLFKQK